MGIFDEAHRLKNVNGSIREAVLALHIRWSLLLTGALIVTRGCS